MERIVINSALSGFMLLDRILDVEAGSMTAQKRFKNEPLFLGIECLAQLGAFHARYVSGFEKHFFLLAIKSFKTAAIKDPLNGEFLLRAELSGRSSSAFSYRLFASGKDAKKDEPLDSLSTSFLPVGAGPLSTASGERPVAGCKVGVRGLSGSSDLPSPCPLPEGEGKNNNLKNRDGLATSLEGEFLFASVEYDTVFKREFLKTHYQRLFSCLKNGSKTDC